MGNSFHYRLASFSWLCIGWCAVLILGIPSSLSAQLLYSFESGTEGWIPSTSALSLAQSTIGATEGTHSLAVETAPGFTNDTDFFDPTADVFNAIAATAGTGKLYDLKADVTFTDTSWDNLSSVGNYFIFNLETNSNGGFQRQTLFQAPPGIQRTFKTATPLLKAYPDPSNLGFVQIRTGKNDDHVNGTEGVTYYLDNVRIQEVTEKKLFSWEVGEGGADNFDGWEDGFDGHVPHLRKIIRSTDSDPYGITDGNSALQFVADAGDFTWGSQFVLDGSDPQSELDSLAADLNAATAIRFDVTMPNDHFGVTFNELGTGSPPPSYFNLYVHVGDNSPNFYQSFDNPIDTGEGISTTVTIPLDELRANNTNLADEGIMGFEGGASTFLRFTLASGAGGPVAFAIDNWRLVSDVQPGILGDFSGNGAVENADLTLLLNNWAQPDTPVPAGWVGIPQPTAPAIDNDELTALLNNWGQSVGSGSGPTNVPEPSCWVLGMVVACIIGTLRRRAS